MKKTSVFACFFAPFLFCAGSYLLYGSMRTSQWLMDIYLMAGAVVWAAGLMTVAWVIQRYLAIKKMEQHFGRQR